MYKWTYSESAQKLENENREQLKIFEMPKKPLYHYTSREVFWLIVESETLLARHTMFSNDYQENRIGIQKIRTAMTSAGHDLTEPDSLPFMICFCEEDDLLSQWRGYAKEGVALEFDFSKGTYGLSDGFSSYYCYSILNHDEKDTDDIKKKYITSDVISGEENFMGAIISPYAVIYTDSESQQDDIILEKLKRIEKEQLESLQFYATGMIPYIKNNKFMEESEYRLIFDMRKLVSEYQQNYLQKKYIYLDAKGIKKPNIRVKFGNQIEAAEKEEITIYYANEKFNDFLNKLKDDLNNPKIKGGATIPVSLKKDSQKFPMESDEILVSSGKHQEAVCVKMRSLMRQQTPEIENVKIWCDGHLPIRRIIVGPSEDANLMKSSIEEYVKTKYWMKDIKVDISQIPLRT